MESLRQPYLQKKGKKRKDKKKKKKKRAYEERKINNKKRWKRLYKVPQWVENRKVTHAKIRRIPLGWKPRQKLGIILEGGEGSLQRSLFPSY